MGEFDIIKRYFSFCLNAAHSLHPEIITGVGDDCAVLDGAVLSDAGKLCVTTDTLVEGVHFFKDMRPEALGSKALAVNLSDLAAMGAKPAFFTLSLVLNDAHATEGFLKPFSEGLRKKAQEAHDMVLVGGNISRGEEFSITITAFGYAPRPLLRTFSLTHSSKALILVTGTVGGAGLFVEHGYGRVTLSPGETRSVQETFEYPPARWDFAREAAPYCLAAIDISDGLYGDLRHLLGLGLKASLKDSALPLHPVLKDLRTLTLEEKLRLALFGGCDYELLLISRTAPEALGPLFEVAHKTGTPLTVIGALEKVQGAGGLIELTDAHGQPLCVKGTAFEHF